MLWEIDIFAAGNQVDRAGEQAAVDARDLGFSAVSGISAARGYLIEGDLTAEQVTTLAECFLAEGVTERTVVAPVGDMSLCSPFGTRGTVVYVLPKPGVTDTVADNARRAFVNFDVPSHSIVIGNPATIHHRDNATEGHIGKVE